MSKHVEGRHHHFSAFYEDNAILIQFIVEEFIHSYQLTSRFQALVQGQTDSADSLHSLFPALIEILNQLVGGLSQQERSSFSHWKKGSLTKFKEYCEHFSYNSSHQYKHHVNLHMAAHRAWLAALHNLEVLHSLQAKAKLLGSQWKAIFSPLRRAFQSLNLRLNQISRYIPRVMDAYWNNENVIFCLLRKKEFLTQIYGYDFLSKHFKWPIKVPEAIELLIKRYQARGFGDLLPTIQHLLESKEVSSVS